MKPGDDIDIRNQALLVIDKLIHVDPSRKIIPYKREDEDTHGPLLNHFDVPKDLDKMKIYLAQPQHNPKTQRVTFYTRFTTTTSITELKRDPLYLNWLKEHKVARKRASGVFPG